MSHPIERLIPPAGGADVRALALLLVDAVESGAAVSFRVHGWIVAGTIPRYALDPDGTPHDAVIFYKELNGADDMPAPGLHRTP